MINSDYWIDEKSDFYFSTAVDIEIAENKEICFVYAKFSRFILIGEITGLNDNSFQYSNLAFEDEFSSEHQLINEVLILEFLSNRVSHMKGFEDLSETQKEKNTKYYENRLEGLKETDFMRILNKYK